jgi:hypothetical protein
LKYFRIRQFLCLPCHAQVICLKTNWLSPGILRRIAWAWQYRLWSYVHTYACIHRSCIQRMNSAARNSKYSCEYTYKHTYMRMHIPPPKNYVRELSYLKLQIYMRIYIHACMHIYLGENNMLEFGSEGLEVWRYFLARATPIVFMYVCMYVIRQRGTRSMALYLGNIVCMYVIRQRGTSSMALYLGKGHI